MQQNLALENKLITGWECCIYDMKASNVLFHMQRAKSRWISVLNSDKKLVTDHLQTGYLHKKRGICT